MNHSLGYFVFKMIRMDFFFRQEEVILHTSEKLPPIYRK